MRKQQSEVVQGRDLHKINNLIQGFKFFLFFSLCGQNLKLSVRGLKLRFRLWPYYLLMIGLRILIYIFLFCLDYLFVHVLL